MKKNVKKKKLNTNGNNITIKNGKTNYVYNMR